MFINIVLILTATISFFTNFDYQNFEANLKNKYIAEHEIKTLDVPFTPQAPFGEWSDQRQQDGCEEASVLMAYYWTQSKHLTLEKAKETILEIADFETKNYGGFVDTSAEDTADRILKEYFGYNNFAVKRKINTEDILFELALGNLILVPANGKLLQNSNFTPPGPDRHMLVIKGYDKKTQEFIANDPGTKMGENYRYNADVLFHAIADYPTGNHAVIETIEKVMIVVRK